MVAPKEGPWRQRMNVVMEKVRVEEDSRNATVVGKSIRRSEAAHGVMKCYIDHSVR